MFICEDKFDIFTCEDNNDVVCGSLPGLIVGRTKIYFYMIEASSKIAWKCSATFCNLLESWENIRKSSVINKLLNSLLNIVVYVINGI